MQSSVAVIDYGAGNIGSVLNIFKKIGVSAFPARTEEELASATHLLLPGVGAFDHCMSELTKSSVLEPFTHAVRVGKKPLLGICVGFQMLFSGSEEGKLPGLGWLEGKVVRFDASRLSPKQKIPHMGWGDIDTAPHPLWKNFDGQRFYFVHSYHPVISGDTRVIATSHYGYDFCCGAAKDNIAGVQFHPEKSHRYGMQLLNNFAQMAPMAKAA
jgi:imidazole glycerol-phosphate synthase subunit HisH